MGYRFGHKPNGGPLFSESFTSEVVQDTPSPLWSRDVYETGVVSEDRDVHPGRLGSPRLTRVLTGRCGWWSPVQVPVDGTTCTTLHDRFGTTRRWNRSGDFPRSSVAPGRTGGGGVVRTPETKVPDKHPPHSTSHQEEHDTDGPRRAPVAPSEGDSTTSTVVVHDKFGETRGSTNTRVKLRYVGEIPSK